MQIKEISKDIYIGSDILEKLNEWIENFDKVLIFSNDTISKIYFEKIKEKIKDIEKTFYFTIKDGEKYKNIETILPVYDFMLENNFSRKSAIISLGGGVICDMGGYLAATYMRGIDFIQVPTSLLAQVDASVGGKVAINHPKCKNMIGSFKQPYKVLVDVDFLKTLELKEFKSGLGELLKHSFLTKDKSYVKYIKENVEKIKKYDENILIKIIEKSILIKKYYVDIDLFEKKERAFLNLGHTYAHALESFYKYAGISHGEAVAKGVIFDLELAYLREKISLKFLEEGKRLFELFEIDSELTFIPEEIIFNLMMKDKKNSFNKIITIGIDKDNNLSKVEVKKEEIIKIIEKYKNNYLRASIDMGTNSCRLTVAEVFENENKKFLKRIIYKDLEMVKLGEKVNENKFLLDSAIERTIDCLKKYKLVIDDFKINENDVVCFATSATRDSKNRDYFIEKVLKNTGIKIECISGEKEAKINFKGVNSAFEKDKIGDVLVFDIGGGSTEFTLGNNLTIKKSKSIDIGSVRITEKFFLEKENYNFSPLKIQEAKSWILDELKKIEEFKEYNFEIIGVAGTVTTQVSVRDRMENYESEKIHLSILKKEEIEDNIAKFLESIPKNLEIIGLDKKRKDVIIGGSLILLTILEFLSKNSLRVSEYDNLIGAILGGLDE